MKLFKDFSKFENIELSKNLMGMIYSIVTLSFMSGVSLGIIICEDSRKDKLSSMVSFLFFASIVVIFFYALRNKVIPEIRKRIEQK